MAKTKNIDIWNYYQKLIQEREIQFVIDTIGGPIPEKFYIVHPAGVMNECFVMGVYISKHKAGLFFNGKHPSNSDCQRIKGWYDANPSLKIEDAVFEYYHYWGDGHKASSGYRLFDSSQNSHIFLNKEVAENCADAKKKAFKEDLEWKELHKKDASYDYKGNGYKFLGWQNGWKHVYFDAHGNQTTDPATKRTFGYTKADYPEYGHCREQKHRVIEVQHDQRGSENTVSCPECKIYWKYDCSD